THGPGPAIVQENPITLGEASSEESARTSHRRGPRGCRSARGAASQPVLRIAGAGLLLGRRLEQIQRAGHVADGPARVIGPEHAPVLRLGVAVSDAVAERLPERLAVAQPRRP